MLELPGLSGASPIGFLAALGVLRVLSEDSGLRVQLSWRDSRALLHGISLEDALNALEANMEGRAQAMEFTWADSTRGISPDQYRDAVSSARGDRRALAFLAGWGTDAVLRDGNIAATRWDMTSGQQKLLQDLRRLTQKVTRPALSIALEGGTYEPQTSFGLDPAAVRAHAHESKAPQKSEPPGKPGLIWLAFESIPLHPVIPVSATRAATVGWRPGRAAAYVWPLWDAPLGLAEVAMLRELPLDLMAKRPGVTAVWASRYGTSGKYGMLLPGMRER